MALGKQRSEILGLTKTRQDKNIDFIVRDIGELFSEFGSIIETQGLSDVLAINPSTGSNDIIVDTNGSNRVFRTNNPTVSDRMAISFFDGGAGQDGIYIGDPTSTLGGILDLGETYAAFSIFSASFTSASISIDSSSKDFNVFSSDGQYDFIFNSTIDLKLQSPDAQSFYGDLTPLNLTADRTWSFPNESGTVALTSDIIANNELTEILANGNSTGANDIVVSTQGANRIIRTDNATSANQMNITFVDGGASGDSISLGYAAQDKGGFLGLYEGNVSIGSWNGGLQIAQLNIDTALSHFLFSSSGGQYDVKFGSTVDLMVQSPNAAGFWGDFTPENLTADRTYTFPDASGTVALTSDVSNFADTDLTFSGARLHDTNGNNLTISSDGLTFADAYLFMSPGGAGGNTVTLYKSGQAVNLTNTSVELQFNDTNVISFNATQIDLAEDIAIADAQNIILDTTTGTQIGTGTTQKLGFYGTTPVVQPTALTASETTLTFVDENTPDFALSSLTTTTPAGFATLNEAQAFVEVVANLQARVNELETKLQSLGAIA